MMARFLNLHPTTIQTLVLTVCIFLAFGLVMPADPLPMLHDVDTYWHLATGDLIRELGTIPSRDRWGFTAGDAVLYNIAWLYDVALSIIFEHFNWHGLIVLNGILMSATIGLIFLTCLFRTQNGVVAFIATIATLSLMNTTIRPHQVSFLCIALLSLILSRVSRKEISERWLLTIPPVILLWVNIHGAVLMGFFLMGWYGLQSLIQKDKQLTLWLTGVGFASCVAFLINPLGVDVVTAMVRLLGSAAMEIIEEWKPLKLSLLSMATFTYIPLFILVMFFQRGAATRSEYWMGYVWLLLALSSRRHLTIFAILSAPLFAIGLKQLMQTEVKPEIDARVQQVCDIALKVSQSARTLLIICVAALLICLAQFSAPAAKFYQTDVLDAGVDFSGEIKFLTTHYPNGRFLNDYNLGGQLIYFAHGKIPTFIDGRVEAAYPREVVEDFVKFQTQKIDWDEIRKKYDLDGLILANKSSNTARYTKSDGWKRAYEGKQAVIFIYTGKSNH